jgi:hypothetical protein
MARNMNIPEEFARWLQAADVADQAKEGEQTAVDHIVCDGKGEGYMARAIIHYRVARQNALLTVSATRDGNLRVDLKLSGRLKAAIRPVMSRYSKLLLQSARKECMMSKLRRCSYSLQ